MKCHSPGGWSDCSKQLLFTTPSAVPALLAMPIVESSIVQPFMKGHKEYAVNTMIRWETGEPNGEAIDFYAVEFKAVDPTAEETLIRSIQSLPTELPEKNYAIEAGQYCSVLHSSDHYWIYSVTDSLVRLLKADSNRKEYMIVNKDAIIIDHYSFTNSVFILFIHHC